MMMIKMSDYCEDPKCKHYGKKLVDLGWGYPVCRSYFAKLYPIPMKKMYKGFKKYYKIVKCNEGKPRRK